MADIFLTVRSINNKNVDAYQQLFNTEKFSGLRSNQNVNNDLVVTEAGDTQNILSNWFVSAMGWGGQNPGGGRFPYEGQRVYWTFESVGTSRYIKIFLNEQRTQLLASGSTVIANGAAGTINLAGVNDYTFNASVLVTIAGGGVNDDTDSGNTLVFTDVYTTRDPQLNGETQFGYMENRALNTKYTVDEDLEEIEQLIKDATCCEDPQS